MLKNVLKTAIFAFAIYGIFVVNLFAADNATVADNKTDPAKTLLLENQDTDIIVKESRKGGAFDEDYYIALKAYEDGFLDVTKESLLAFLKKDSRSAQAGFATYILYQIYMMEGDFKAAKTEFTKLKNFNDKRFDKNKLEADEIRLIAKNDCKEAKKLLLSRRSDIQMKTYIDSGCEISGDVVDYVAAMPFAEETVILVIDKIKDDKDRMLSVYNNLSPEKRKGKLLNFYGHYFALNKMYADFWRLFSEYKDVDMVNIALDDVWNTGDHNRYVDFFDKNIGDYKLANVSYCRFIEASNKMGKNFDCQIVDGCLGVTNPQYNKTKLACYMKNEDKKGISLFMKNLSTPEAGKLCEYSKYIVAKNIYSPEFLGKFSSCAGKEGMFEALIKNKDYKGMINLAGKKHTDTDKAYLAIAYYLSGNKAEGDKFFGAVTDERLKKIVQARIGAIK